MRCGLLFLSWRGLVFGPSWGFIECLQTQLYGLVKVLDLCGNHLCWYKLYVPRITSNNPTGINSMLSQIWIWWHHWWILNVSHVGSLNVFIPARRLIHWSYYICSYCRFGIQNKELSLVKLCEHGRISFSHILHWSYLLMFLQQGRLCGAWIEDVPKQSQMNIKRPWDLWIRYCWIFCQELKWTYYCTLGSGILCSWVTKVFAHHLPTRYSYTRRIQGYLHISLSWWSW